MASNVGTAFVDIKAKISDDFNRDINNGLDRTEKRLGTFGETLTKIGAVHALAGLAGEAVQLTAALAPALGVVVAIPAAAGAGAVVLGTLKIATAGVGDAMTALASGDAKKLGEALQGLSPNAKQFVGAIQGIYPEFKKIQQSAQDKFFYNLKSPVETLAKSSFPTLRAGLTDVADAFNYVITEATATMSTSLFQGGLTAVFKTASFAVAEFGILMKPLLQAFAVFALVGGSVVRNFIAMTVNALAAKAAFYGTSEGGIRLQQILESAGYTMSQLWTIGKNLVAVIIDIFKGSQQGDLLGQLVVLTTQMRAFIESAKGQEAIKQIFAALQHTFDSFAGTLPVMVGLLTGIFQAFNAMPGPIKDLTSNMVAYSLVFGPITQGIAKITVGMKGAIAVASGFGTVVSKAFLLITGSTIQAAAATAYLRALYIADWIAMRVTALASAVQMAAAWFIALGPIGWVILGITAVIAIVVLLVKNWSTIGPVLASVGSAILSFFAGLPGMILGFVGSLLGTLGSLGMSLLTAMAQGIAIGAVAVFNFFISLPGLIAYWLGSLVAITLSAGITTLLGMLYGILIGFAAVGNFFLALPGVIAGFLSSAGVWLVQHGIEALLGLLLGVTSGAQAVFVFFLGLPSRIASFLASAPRWLVTHGLQALQGLKSGAEAGAGAVYSFMQSIPGRIMDGFRGAATWLLTTGHDIIQGLLNGLKSAGGAVLDYLLGLASNAIQGFKDKFHIGSPSKVFHSLGFFIGQGLANGLASTQGMVNKAMDTMTSGIGLDSNGFGGLAVTAQGNLASSLGSLSSSFAVTPSNIANKAPVTFALTVNSDDSSLSIQEQFARMQRLAPPVLS